MTANSLSVTFPFYVFIFDLRNELLCKEGMHLNYSKFRITDIF